MYYWSNWLEKHWDCDVSNAILYKLLFFSGIPDHDSVKLCYTRNLLFFIHFDLWPLLLEVSIISWRWFIADIFVSEKIIMLVVRYCGQCKVYPPEGAAILWQAVQTRQRWSNVSWNWLAIHIFMFHVKEYLTFIFS